MVEAIVVTILTSLIVVWVGFSMAGRDEARVSASVDLNKWYQVRKEASIYEIEEIEILRDYVTLTGRGEQLQKGYQLMLEYKDLRGYSKTTKHQFYDETEQDEEFLQKYISDNQMYVWLSKDNEVYVPGEIKDNKDIQSIYGADRVLTYSLLTALGVGLISVVFVLLLKPFWAILHLPIVILTALIPQIVMYIQEMSSEVQRLDYEAVGALSQYSLQIDEDAEGLTKYKLVEQTLPMVLLNNGVGYLGYHPDEVKVLVDYDGDIPVHIASEYHIPDLVKTAIDKFRK